VAATKHIVVADDDEGVRFVLAEILSELGHRVSIASNGKALREIVDRRDRVDLVVLDSLMPGEDSMALAAHLGDLRIPVVAISGHPLTMMEALEQGRQLLEKPFGIAALMAAIEEAFASEEYGRRMTSSTSVRQAAEDEWRSQAAIFQPPISFMTA
jgi:two-component system, OmpR family, response regulator